MQKQALVHLHALCDRLREDLEDREAVPPGAFEQYDELRVAPSSIYRRKEAHRRANQRLLEGLTTVIERREAVGTGKATTDGGTDSVRTDSER